MPKMLTAWSPGNARTDVVWVGGLFRASVDQVIFALGLYVFPGNSGPADVYLVDQITGTVVAQVSVNMSGAQSPLGFVYASLGSPVTMLGGRAYALSAYSAQMAQWANTGPISTTSDFTAADQCYSTSGPGGVYVDYGNPGSMYVGCDLVYGAPLSPPGIWTPNLVADVVLEADSMSGAADASSVLSWPGTGKNSSYSGTAQSGSAPVYKVNILNGYPVVRFSGSQLVTVPGVAVSGLTVGFVGQQNAVTAYGMFTVYGDSAVNDWELRCSGNSSDLQYIANGGNYSVSTSGSLLTSWHIWIAVYLAGTNNASLYLDGAQYAASGSSGPVAASGQSFYVGERYDGYGVNGDIPAAILVGSDLATSDRQKIEGYLAAKYGLQSLLPAGHPYKSAPPMLPAPAGGAAALLSGL